MTRKDGQKPSPPGHGRPTDRRPLGRIPCLPGGYHPVTPAPPRGCARSLIGSINEQHAGCHFPGQGRRQACQTDRGAVPSGFQRAAATNWSMCTSATPGARARWWCWKRRCPTCITRPCGCAASTAWASSPSPRFPTPKAGYARCCGADACLSPEVSGLELAAVLQALVRRAAGMDAEPGDIPANGEPPSDAWRLANKGWTLISPGGRTMGLTTGERDFLSRLVHAPDRKVSRDAFYADGADDADSGVTRRRFVDVMISRLRRKATANHDPAHPRGARLGLYVRGRHQAGPGRARAGDDGAEEWRRDTAVANATSY